MDGLMSGVGTGIGIALKKTAATAAMAGAAMLAASSPPLNTIYNFTGYGSGTDYPNTGNFEVSQLLQAGDGNFYGVSAFGGVNEVGYVFKLDAATGQLSHLHDFAFADGATPRGALFQGSDGELYGTTEAGGANQSDFCLAVKFYNQPGCGTAFKISTGGVFTKLHDFYSAADGYQVTPSTGMVQAGDGNFYGMSYRAFPSGTTSIFRMTPDGTVSVHYLFASDESQGDDAVAGLLLGRDGKLYGSTAGAGAISGHSGLGCGTVFRAGTDGSFQLLHTFAGAASGIGDGCLPWGRLIQGRDGNFYGTTAYGGYQKRNCIAGGCGIVFKLTPDGTETILHRFTATAKDGEYPEGDGLVQAADGSFYGTTIGNPYAEGAGFVPLCVVGGSTAFSCGTVYRIDRRGRYSQVSVFGQSDSAQGLFPHASLTVASDGNLYGSTISGGSDGPGTIYRVLLNSSASDAIGGEVSNAAVTPALAQTGTVVLANPGGGANRIFTGGH